MSSLATHLILRMTPPGIRDGELERLVETKDEARCPLWMSETATWREAAKNLRHVVISSPLADVVISLDWAPALSYLQQQRADILESSSVWEFHSRLDLDDIDLPCEVLVSDGDVHEALRHFEFILHSIFLSMNLSSPGCFDLYGARILVDGGDSRSVPRLATECSKWRLSGFSFDAARESSSRLGWPQIGRIPLPDAWGWIQRLDIGVRMRAETRTERALFALLHFTLVPDQTATGLIWLTNCLEALYDTPKDGIFKALRDRIFLALGKPTANAKRIRQQMSQLYDCRSKFVHGELPLIHPMSNDIVDPSIRDLIGQIRDSEMLASSIVVATLQLLISNKWECLSFKDTLTGCPLS